MIIIQINDAEVTAALERAIGAVSDLTPLMQSIGEILVVSTKARFGEGVAPDGSPWAPNSPVTLARKKGTKPLIGDDGLLNSQIFAEATADSVEVGSNRIQAAVMQFGAAQGEFGAAIGKDKKGRDHFHSIPWGDIPARPFLGLSDADRGNILDEISEYLGDVLSS
ncbi:MAG: phage virion morphogenesis protein [Cypionkella sp.]